MLDVLCKLSHLSFNPHNSVQTERDRDGRGALIMPNFPVDKLRFREASSPSQSRTACEEQMQCLTPGLPDSLALAPFTPPGLLSVGPRPVH